MANNHWDKEAVRIAKEMGRQWRQRWLGEVPKKYGEKRHDVGFAARSLLGKLKEEGIEGASQSTAVRDQFSGEAFTRDALLGRRIMAEVMNDKEREAFEAHFFITGIPVKFKAHYFGWKVSTYYWTLNRAMRKFTSRLRSTDQTQSVSD